MKIENLGIDKIDMDYVNKYENIFISFSGGRTSAFMTKWIIDNFKDTHNIKILFANTGQEHEETYKFIKNCTEAWGLDVTWIESVVRHGEKKSNTWKIVDFESATRDVSLFVESCKKYGLPNQAAPNCTKHLKTAPMHNYIKDNGWKTGEYITAVGIRADELDRINPNYRDRHCWYPLGDIGVTKPQILDFFRRQSFDLRIPEYLGNCTWCWKKTLRKHMTLIEECPDIYEAPRLLEKQFRNFYRGDNLYENQTLFRKGYSVEDLFKLHAEGNFELWVDEYFNDCAESCEAMGTEKSEAMEDEVIKEVYGE